MIEVTKPRNDYDKLFYQSVIDTLVSWGEFDAALDYAKDLIYKDIEDSFKAYKDYKLLRDIWNKPTITNSYPLYMMGIDPIDKPIKDKI